MAEVVPVSSSAQLVLLPWLWGWDQPADRTLFGAVLHAGSCLGISAVLIAAGGADRRTLLLVAASSVPAAVAGLLTADRVEARLGQPPQLAALLAGFGALLWAADRWSPQHRQIGPREVTFAAAAQVVALVPGVSRSGATLTTLRLAGVERAAAQRFSLLMSLPVTAGAAGLTLARADRAAVRPLASSLAVGALAAAAAAAVAASAQAHRPGRSMNGPALYRFALAAVVARRLRTSRRRAAPGATATTSYGLHAS